MIELDIESETLTFKPEGLDDKTFLVYIDSKLYGYRLGVIKWHEPQKQYLFWPETNTGWDAESLDTVQECIADSHFHKNRLAQAEKVIAEYRKI